MNKRLPIFLGFLLVVFFVWLQTTSFRLIKHWRIELDHAAYDFQLRAKIASHTKSLETNIAIVDIDDRSLRVEGRWPWSRDKLAKLTQQIQALGATVIAYDMLFSEEEKNIANLVFAKLSEQKLLPNQTITPLLNKIAPYFNNDQQFADHLKQSDAILGVTFIPRPYFQGKLKPPLFTLTTTDEKNLDFFQAPGYLGNIPPLEAASKGMGFINVFNDEDGIIRRVPLLMRYQNNIYPSLALEAVKTYLLTTVNLVIEQYGSSKRIEGIKLGKQLIPTDSSSQVIIPFQGKSFTFPYYSATDILNHTIQKDLFTGKIIFVGTSAIGVGDLKPTAIQNIYPGVEIQASIADGLMKNHFPYTPDWATGLELTLTLFIGIFFSCLFPFVGPRILAILAVGLPVSFMLLNSWIWSSTGLIFSILIPMLLTFSLGILNIVYGYFFEVRKREHLKEMFGQYVPEKHIDEMLQSKGNYGLYGEDRVMTVLFADIRNFTTLSEKLTASQLKNLLNDFFTPMTETIFKYRGTIDKYVGDLLMAFWGAPLKDKRHAERAIAAALDMQKKVKTLNQSRPDNPITIGIGLNSGLMSVGDMGSKFRRNYTVLGDAVNLASRVESLSKFYGVPIIVTENTRNSQKKFVFKELDKVRVKGKEQGVRIYEVLCYVSELTPTLGNELTLHDAALKAYYEQKWLDAKTRFEQLAKLAPKTKLYSLYLERIEKFQLTPPPSNWDGIYEHLTK